MLLKNISIISIPEAFIQRRVMELGWQKGFVYSDMLKGPEIRNNSHISSSWLKIFIYRKYFKNKSFEEILYSSGFSFVEALELTSPGKSLQIHSSDLCVHIHSFQDIITSWARSMFCSGHSHAMFWGISWGSSFHWQFHWTNLYSDGCLFSFPKWWAVGFCITAESRSFCLFL